MSDTESDITDTSLSVLEQRIISVFEEKSVTIGRLAIEEIKDALLGSLDVALSVDQQRLISEIRTIGEYIREAKAELASLQDEEFNPEHIRNATDELDAVVSATEEATGNIMDACEKIEAEAEKAGGELGDSIVMQVTAIYEACSFQDITGQRIGKVVNALKKIENRVNHVVEGFDGLNKEGPDGVLKRNEQGHIDDKASGLLNGPQIDGSGVDQDEIDRLLSEM